MSAWTNREALEAFVHQDPHGAGVASIRPHMKRSSFAFWTARPEDLPVKWDEVRRRINAEASARGA